MPRHISGVQFQKRYFLSALSNDIFQNLLGTGWKGHRCDNRTRTFLKCPGMENSFLEFSPVGSRDSFPDVDSNGFLGRKPVF